MGMLLLCFFAILSNVAAVSTCTSSAANLAAQTQSATNLNPASSSFTSNAGSQFYNTQLDLVNGFTATFVYSATFGSPNGVDPSTYPTVQLVLSTALPFTTSGTSFPITISPLGLIVIGSTQSGTANMPATGVVQYTATIKYDTINLVVTVGGTTATVAMTPAALTSAMGNSVGYVGLQTASSPFLVAANNWSTFSFSSLSINTIPPSNTNSVSTASPSTITAGGSITVLVSVMDTCNQTMSSTSILNSFVVSLVPSNQKAVLSIENAKLSSSFTVTASGKYDINIALNGNSITGFPTAANVLTVSPSSLLGSNTMISAVAPGYLLSNSPFVLQLTAEDQYGNYLITQPPVNTFIVNINDHGATIPSTTANVSLTWVAASNNYALSISATAVNSYDLHVFYNGGSKEIPQSPFGIVVVQKLADVNTPVATNWTLIIGCIIGGLALIIGGYGLWRGRRYMEKYRAEKKRREQKEHDAKIAKHDNERATALVANPLQVEDDGGYTTQQEVEDAKMKCQKQADYTKLQQLELEKIDIAIQIKQEQIAKAKMNIQQKEVKSEVLKPTKQPKKKAEFSQNAETSVAK